ncbi:MAG: hypothetical protein HS105_13105 [Chloracidobacterium sp.]|nr:hypothetical protein [Chloracidobacterium sp.]MCO5334141.1 hypothetical protein [Pyrinomonadaceae bacterium]
MKRNVMFAAVAVLVFSFAAFGQDYSGTWNLDKAASKLDDRSKNIESMTLTITQTEKEITVATETKRAMSSEGGRMGGRMGGGMMGDSTTTYSLDGKAKKTEVKTQNGSMPASLKAKNEKDKLELTRDVSFSSPMGEVTILNKETLTLSADGRTLTMHREMSSPRGTTSNTFVFHKQ